MGEFMDQIRYFHVETLRAEQAVFVNVASAIKTSVVEGSSVTGAPGQPVDTGNLRNSFQLEFDGPDSALISTNVDYAEDVEDNIRGVTFHNHGPHSAKLTVASFDLIVADETQKLVGSNP